MLDQDGNIAKAPPGHDGEAGHTAELPGLNTRTGRARRK